MKLRAFRALNCLALCILLFAGYLNFFKKDKDQELQKNYRMTRPAHPSKNTVLISNPEQYLKDQAKSETAQTTRLHN